MGINSEIVEGNEGMMVLHGSTRELREWLFGFVLVVSMVKKGAYLAENR